MKDTNISGKLYADIRRAFVEEEQRPTYQELEERFNVAERRIQARAYEEGWALQRAKFIEAKLKESKAGEVILESIGINRAVTQAVANFGIRFFQTLGKTLEKLKEDGAASSQAKVLNDLGWAAANGARALKDAGIVGLPKELADAGKLGNGQWQPSLLAQINVTVQQLIQQSGTGLPAAASSLPAPEAVQVQPAELPAPNGAEIVLPDVTQPVEKVPEPADALAELEQRIAQVAQAKPLANA